MFWVNELRSVLMKWFCSTETTVFGSRKYLDGLEIKMNVPLYKKPETKAKLPLTGKSPDAWDFILVQNSVFLASEAQVGSITSNLGCIIKVAKTIWLHSTAITGWNKFNKPGVLKCFVLFFFKSHQKYKTFSHLQYHGYFGGQSFRYIW